MAKPAAVVGRFKNPQPSRPLPSRVYFPIGLRPNEVMQLDQIAQTQGLRNRSEAVEHLLDQLQQKK
jgi:hypothetical protein